MATEKKQKCILIELNSVAVLLHSIRVMLTAMTSCLNRLLPVLLLKLLHCNEGSLWFLANREKGIGALFLESIPANVKRTCTHHSIPLERRYQQKGLVNGSNQIENQRCAEQLVRIVIAVCIPLM